MAFHAFCLFFPHCLSRQETLPALANSIQRPGRVKVKRGRLTSSHKRGCRGRRPLQEREVSSHVSLLHGEPQARQKNYEWISGDERFPQHSFEMARFDKLIIVPHLDMTSLKSHVTW